MISSTSINNISIAFSFLLGRNPVQLINSPLNNILPIQQVGEVAYESQLNTCFDALKQSGRYLSFRISSVYQHIKGHSIGVLLESILYADDKGRPEGIFLLVKQFWIVEQNEISQNIKPKIEVINKKNLD